MAVDVLCQLRILESLDGRNDEQDGEDNRNIHLWPETEKSHEFSRACTVRNFLEYSKHMQGCRSICRNIKEISSDSTSHQINDVSAI